MGRRGESVCDVCGVIVAAVTLVAGVGDTSCKFNSTVQGKRNTIQLDT